MLSATTPDDPLYCYLGLGKNADGITKAIEVTKKDNTNGVGMREDWSNTFESMFDKLASNIQIGGSSSDEDRNVIILSNLMFFLI